MAVECNTPSGGKMKGFDFLQWLRLMVRVVTSAVGRTLVVLISEAGTLVDLTSVMGFGTVAVAGGVEGGGAMVSVHAGH